MNKAIALGYRLIGEPFPFSPQLPAAPVHTLYTLVMDLCAAKGVKLIVRVIPDPAKDIGFTILSRFHYHEKARMVVCETLAEAGKHLGF